MTYGEEVFNSEETGLSYEWNEFHVYKARDGKFFVDQDSGCSCNYYETPTKFDGFEPMTWFKVTEEYKAWAKDETADIRARELGRLIEAMRNSVLG